MLSDDEEFEAGIAHSQRRFKISEKLNQFYYHDGGINAIFHNSAEGMLALYIDVPQDGWFKQGVSGFFLFFDVELKKANPPLERTIWKNTVNSLLNLNHVPELDTEDREVVVLWACINAVNGKKTHYDQELQFISSGFQWFSLMPPETDAN
jgi:hypothetical protein